MPVPMVWATCSPNTMKAMKLKNARPEHRELRPQHAGRDDGRDRIGGVVQAVQEVEQQRDGDQADEDRKTRARHPRRGPALNLLDDDAVDLVRDVVETVGHLLEMVVDLGADDEIHRVTIAVLEEQLLQPDVVEIVDPALELASALP